MAYFDFIHKRNNEPQSDQEYVYLHNLVWKPKKLQAFNIQYGSIVHNVVRLENGSYEFQLKGDTTNETYCTDYGWSLAIKNDDNLQRIKEYEDANAELIIFTKKVKALQFNIETLNGININNLNDDVKIIE